MNLKKTDKIIAILGVVILIIAAIGVLLLTGQEDTEEPEDEKPKTKGFNVYWESKEGTTITEEGTAGKEPATGTINLNVPENAVLTNVDVKIKWTDNKGLSLPLVGQIMGKDTLTATVTAPNEKNGDYTGKGGVVENDSVGTFSINSPVDEVYDEKTTEDVMVLIEELYNFDSTIDYEVTVDAKGLFDKDNSFTLVVDYEYAVYTIGDKDSETNDDSDDDNTTTSQPSISERYINIVSGLGTFN